MRYRILFCLSSKEWFDQITNRRYEINEAYRELDRWIQENIAFYPLDRWAIIEETTDPTSLPQPASIK